MSDIIVKSNMLITAREKKTLSALEQKIVLRCVTRVEEKTFEEAIEFSIFDIFGRKDIGIQQYKSFRKACSELAGTTISFEEFEDGEWMRGEYIPIFEKIKADRKKGNGTFIFNRQVKNHIIGLKKNFTSYDYKHIQEINSGFAIRIYELLIQGKNKYRSREFSITSLLDVLSVSEMKTYQNFTNIKKAILDKSCKEITEKTDINCSWEVSKKEGRKITHILFIWQYKEGQSPEELKEEKEEKKKQKGKKSSIQVKDSSLDNEKQPSLSAPIPETINNTDRSQEEKKITLITRLMELGLTIDEAYTITNKTQALPESGIWKAINAVKMGLKDGLIKSARAVLIAQFLS